MNLVAKLAKPTILPSSPVKSMRRPYSVLEDQPSEKFTFGGCPRFPNQGGHQGGGMSQKLHVIGRRRRVAFVVGELRDRYWAEFLTCV